jgi:hypothetical protein
MAIAMSLLLHRTSGGQDQFMSTGTEILALISADTPGIMVSRCLVCGAFVAASPRLKLLLIAEALYPCWIDSPSADASLQGSNSGSVFVREYLSPYHRLRRVLNPRKPLSPRSYSQTR